MNKYVPNGEIEGVTRHHSLICSLTKLPSGKIVKARICSDFKALNVETVLWQPRFEGDTLCQENIVSMTSRGLKPYERNFSVYPLELLAFLFALKTYHDFVCARPVYTCGGKNT